MDGEPRYRTIRVHEDADEDSVVVVRRPVSLVERRYSDRHPWRCGWCNQPNEPEWPTCATCGQHREDCEI